MFPLRKGSWSHWRQLLFLLVCLALYTVATISQVFLPRNPPKELEMIRENAIPTVTDRYRHSNFTFDFPLCLVHVGKTAGSSISCGLGLMYANCEGVPREPPAPHVNYFHMRKRNCYPSSLRERNSGPTTATFLMTVRNPLSRIQSWFDFEKDRLPTRRNKQDEQRLRWKRRMIFQECYDNFVHLVTDGLDLTKLQSTRANSGAYQISAERPINMTCPERAWAAVLGVREFSYHEWYNYEHYWTALDSDFHLDPNNNVNQDPKPVKLPSLLVLRTEHLSRDWSKISREELFRQVNKGSLNSSATLFSISNEDSILPKYDMGRFWTNLCRAMCPEIQIYQQILERADNMEAPQVEESIREVQETCPEYRYRRPCPDIPEFPLLKIPSRQYAGETKKRLFAIG